MQAMQFFIFITRSVTCGSEDRPLVLLVKFCKYSWLYLMAVSPVSGVQVVMQLVRLLPDGHRMKREVDMALDSVSETMTPMHYHLREIIICTYRQVRADTESTVVCVCVCVLSYIRHWQRQFKVTH